MPETPHDPAVATPGGAASRGAGGPLDAAASPGGDAVAGTAAAGGGHFGAEAGFGARPAVVVVDLNLGFTDPASPLACDLDDVVIRTSTLLDVARRMNVPVFFTTVVYDEAGELAAAVFLRKVPALKLCRPGTRWVEIDPRLGRLCSEPVIAKAHASAFFGVPFATMLTGRDTLIVCGASTSGCVRATVVDAMQYGFAPIVPRECVGDRSSRAHEQALSDIEGRYGDVRSVAEVIAALEAIE